MTHAPNFFVHLALGVVGVLFLTSVVIKIGSSSSSKASLIRHKHSTRLEGALEAGPLNLSRCVTLRLRGDEATEGSSSNGLSSEDWSSNNHNHTIATSTTTTSSSSTTVIPLGLVLVENPDEFVSLGKPGTFHLFHFLEFLVIFFAEWQALQQNQELADFQLAWVHAPLLTRHEICGVGRGLNCVILNLLLGGDDWGEDHAKDDDKTKIYGLEAIRHTTRASHPAYQGQLTKRNRFVVQAKEQLDYSTTITNTYDWSKDTTYSTMVSRVDAILLLDRPRCKDEQRVNLRKIITNYVGHFPAHEWYRRVQTGLAERGPFDKTSGKTTITTRNAPPPQQTQQEEETINVCYIDRQKSNRRMPQFYHQWLLSFIDNHSRLHLMHLFMERYEPIEQIRLASTCHVLLGVHGNGLSHAMWMKPGRFVLEFFWNFFFRYDYASLAQVMEHRYVCLVDGSVPTGFETDILKIQNRTQVFRPPQQRQQVPDRIDPTEADFDAEALEDGKRAMESFMEEAIRATLK